MQVMWWIPSSSMALVSCLRCHLSPWQRRQGVGGGGVWRVVVAGRGGGAVGRAGGGGPLRGVKNVANPHPRAGLGEISMHPTLISPRRPARRDFAAFYMG